MSPLAYLVQANLILIVLVLAYALLLRRTTRFGLNRAVLWIIAFEALFLPFVQFPQVRHEPVRAVMTRTAAVLREPLRAVVPQQPRVYFTFPDGKTYPATFNEPLGSWLTTNWPTAIVWLYGLVVIGSLIRLGWRIIRLRLLIERGSWIPYHDFMLVDTPVDTPFSFGRFVILNLRLYGSHELEQILRHEWAHVRQHHTIDVLLSQCLTAVCWLNPAAYLFQKLVYQNLEYLADEAVLTEGVDARTYQLSLLQVSMGADRLALGNGFTESSLGDRIRMMLRPRSGSGSWLRYWLLAGLLGIIILALTLRDSSRDNKTNTTAISRPDCSDLEWLNETTANQPAWNDRIVFNSSNPIRTHFGNMSVVGLQNNHLTVLEDYRYNTQVYIDCEPASVEALGKVESEYIDELYVYEQSAISDKSEDYPWRVVVLTSPRVISANPARNMFLTYLQAATLTKHPLGLSESFSMNDVLEATFFHRKNVMVDRTKNEHLKLYDEFVTNTDVRINGLLADPKAVETIHVREVDKIYTREFPYGVWFGPNSPRKRYSINIETSPKRARRDSSYYVFSPFYSGDF